MIKILILFICLVFLFALLGYELFYFLFNKQLTVLNLIWINLFVFFISILFALSTITLAKLVGDVRVFSNRKAIYYWLFFLKMKDLSYDAIAVFWLENVLIILLLIFISLVICSIHYSYIKNENNSSSDFFTQISGFFDLFFKYLTLFSILLFFFFFFIIFYNYLFFFF